MNLLVYTSTHSRAFATAHTHRSDNEGSAGSTRGEAGGEREAVSVPAASLLCQGSITRQDKARDCLDVYHRGNVSTQSLKSGHSFPRAELGFSYWLLLCVCSFQLISPHFLVIAILSSQLHQNKSPRLIDCGVVIFSTKIAWLFIPIVFYA